MNLSKKLKLPKEHGAWAMLYVPFVLGVAVAGTFPASALLLLICVSTLFISRESLLVWLRAKRRKRPAVETRKMLLMYAVLAGVSGLPLLVIWKYYWLIPLGLLGVSILAFNGAQGSQLAERSVFNEALAIVGLTMSAPASYTVALGVWDEKALWLWGFCAVYFASSVFFIKHSLSSVHGKSTILRNKARFQCAIYHGLLLTILLALVTIYLWPFILLMAFAPILIRAFWSVVYPPEKINLRRIGITELVYSLIFLTLVTISFIKRA